MKVVAIYDSESSPGQKIEVLVDDLRQAPSSFACTCKHFAGLGACKHIMDYDMNGAKAAESIVDPNYSSVPISSPVAAVEEDGEDAKDFEKPSTRELEPDVEEAVKQAARKMKGE